MAVSLVKGGNVSLTKEAPTMNVAMVGLGWDARVTDGQGFDLLIVAVAFTGTVVALVLYRAIRAGFVIEENEMRI